MPHNTGHAELVEVARRNGWVRWHHSGVAEKLSLEDGVVFAEGPTTRRHWISKKKTHYCMSIPEPWVSIGELTRGYGPNIGYPHKVYPSLRRNRRSRSGRQWV